jgi:UDP-N-acetylglucosamine--N-acetylmuramyl-(pentapeptide) pyrophosphoryl-undecaprenol N-acetylglucosamine transferase
VRAQPLHILFAGGGTGGHLFPALAIAEEVGRMRPGTRISFAGTADRIEARIIPPLGYAFFTIWISGFRRRLSLQTLLVPLKIVVSLVQSALLLRRSRPQAVVGTGGYVCGPVVYMASAMGIPTVIQEQNSYPGVTTRLLASRATRVYLTFEETRSMLPGARDVVVSGNPTRGTVGEADRVQAHTFFGTDPGKRTLLVFGGSLGARSINDAVAALLPGIAGAGVQVLWQTGEQDYERMHRMGTGAEGGGAVSVFRFIDRMDLAYAAADLVLCRAGATTLAELTRAGLPSILVPYPHAAADHQTANARAMVAAGASLMIRDTELHERLSGELHRLLADDGARQAMRAGALALSRPGAAKTIAGGVIQLAEAYAST